MVQAGAFCSNDRERNVSVILGAIADDFTGATDLANTLVRRGMRTVQALGVPDQNFDYGDADAVVIALKSRTCPVNEAVDDSVAGLKWLETHDVRQTLFKYCSTFDSTPSGNIGPVAEALLDHLQSDFTIACPAFPENQRTIFKGHLFVGNVLLNASGMQNHPLTPMDDANLVNVLNAQTQGDVGLVEWNTVRQGADAIRHRFDDLRKSGIRHAIVDAIDDADLELIGAACESLKLITGGSGIALGLPENFRRQGVLHANDNADSLPEVGGLQAVVSGSCSVATRQQVSHMQASHPSWQLTAAHLDDPAGATREALAFAEQHLDSGPVLFFSSATPEEVAQVQERLGRDRAGQLVEQTLAAISAGLVERGVRKLVVAGGETSGAVVSGIGVKSLRIGPQIDPGVPWTLSQSTDGPTLALALKSGNFGSEDFFTKALSQLA